MGIKRIWDGQDLPPIGSEVLAQLGSEEKKPDQGWVRHIVSGYRIEPACTRLDETAQHFHRKISIKLEAHPDEPRSWKNERHLGDIRPVDWRPS